MDMQPANTRVNQKNRRAIFVLLIAVAAVLAGVLLWPGDDAEQNPAVGQRDVVPLLRALAAMRESPGSPDGRKIVSAARDGSIILWNMETGQGRSLDRPAFREKFPVRQVAFSPDGKTVASAGLIQSVLLWDAETAELLMEPRIAYRNDIRRDQAVSPDGNLIAAAAEDHTIILWDRETGGKLGPALRGHSGDIFYLAFNSRGKTLVSESRHEKLVWDVDPEALQKRGCAAAGRNFTCEEWREFMGDKPYQKVCEDWPEPVCR